ncbi:MAG: pyridoxamine 5'-phosphate oxidase family protein [Candidatus Dormibacteria bacterium]
MSEARTTLDEIAEFLTTQALGVVSSLGPDGQPQAALVGLAVSDRLEFVFDSVDSSRKIGNLRRDPRVAIVIGGTMQDERTVQVEGFADEPIGAERERVSEAYFHRWPDGRDRMTWAGITHVRITPHWLRWSDWRGSQVGTAEWVRSGGVLVPS